MAKIPRSAAAAPKRVDLLHVSVSFKPEAAAALTEAATQTGMTRTALVRWIVEEWLRENRLLAAAPRTSGPSQDAL
jgi:hypothetical protein